MEIATFFLMVRHYVADNGDGIDQGKCWVECKYVKHN